MSEVDEAAKMIAAAADPDANIIFGATIDETMHDQIKITVIATGFDQTKQRLQQFVPKPEEQAPIEPQKPETPKQDEDVFEIPAFLRQRN